MISLNNKLMLSATLLLAPAINAASPSSDFALGAVALAGATAVVVKGWEIGPNRFEIRAFNPAALVKAAVIYPVSLYVATDLAKYGHKKLGSATDRSSLLKRLYHFGNGAVAAALFYKTFLKTSPNRNTNIFKERTATGLVNATSNALAAYALVSWGPHLLNTAYDSFSKAFEAEKSA